MDQNTYETIVAELMDFANHWNKLYAEEKFEEMKLLATEDVAIANARTAKTVGRRPSVT